MKYDMKDDLMRHHAKTDLRQEGERYMKNSWKKGFAVLLTASMTMALAACGGQPAASGETEAGEAGSGEAGTVVVGSKDFTENEIVAEIYALALEDAGFKVERKMNIAGSVVHTSIQDSFPFWEWRR